MNQNCKSQILRRSIERYSGDLALKFDVRETMAIAIGPSSHFDRCLVFPEGKGPRGFAAGISTKAWDRVERSEAIEVSVERPHIGYLKGPFLVMFPYGRSAYQVDRPVVSGSFITALFGSESYQPIIKPSLDLQFFDFLPAFLPTKRAPLDFAMKLTEFGTASGYTTKTIVIPGWGRKLVSLSFDDDAPSAAGSFDVTFTGYNAAEAINGATEKILSAETLLTATLSVGVDAERSYLFDGEFDYYQLVVTENAAIPAFYNLGLIVKAWD